MTMIATGRVCGGLLLGLICGTALAQNNPGGPPDQAGTANNIPGSAGTPGTFNAHNDTATSSQGKPGTPGAASSQPTPSGTGAPPAMTAPGTGNATSR